MDDARQLREEQAALWNGSSGEAWVAAQAVLDDLFRPVEALLADAAAALGATNVLDVGCGTGATTIALARRLGASATCTGVDLSAPMIDVARERAAGGTPRPRFVCADAGTHPFEPDAFDLLTSRFGVMFFGDPVAVSIGGGGGGNGPEDQGSGGGFGGMVRGIGVYSISNGQVRFVPAVDTTALGAMLVLAIGLVAHARRRRRV